MNECDLVVAFGIDEGQASGLTILSPVTFLTNQIEAVMNESLDKLANANRLFEQRNEQLGHLPAQILLDLARNEAATREWRKAAVILLIEKNFPQANHPDLVGLVMEIRSEHLAKHDVQAVVESAIEEELTGMTASVTTASLQQDEVIPRNPMALSDDALAEDSHRSFLSARHIGR